MILSVDNETQSVHLTCEEELPFTITRELVGYSVTKDETGVVYTIPPYSNNCFVLFCLLQKGYEIQMSDDIREALKKTVNTLPVPSASVMGQGYIILSLPPIYSYMRLVSCLHAKPFMQNQYKVPFTRLYETYMTLSAWKHDFLLPVKIKKGFLSLVTEPLDKDLFSVPLGALRSVEFAYQLKQEGFDKLGYEKAVDLILKRPSRYENRTHIISWDEVRFREACYIKGVICDIQNMSGRLYIQLQEEQSKTEVDIIFFGQSYLASFFSIGDTAVAQVVKIGKSKANGSSLLFVEDVNAFPVKPIYKQSPKNNVKTAVICQSVMELFLRFCGQDIAPYFSKSLWDCLYRLHFPKSSKDYYTVLRDLSIMEMTYLQLLFVERKALDTGYTGLSKLQTGKTSYAKEATKHLPYTLTEGQVNAVKTFVSKLQTSSPEKLLLSADVGLGKSVVGFLCALYVADCGYQTAIMAPTEILAEQLYYGLLSVITPLSVKPKIAFLSGKTKAKERQQILEGLSDGSISVIVGTHAVAGVTDFHNLGLVIVDEQQKMGARIKEQLLYTRKDGRMPDLISQTATPIPRTTALAFYGDVDLVQIKDRPKDRKEIYTEFLRNVNSEDFLNMRKGLNAWGTILSEVKKGHQIFIVAPAVEEGVQMISVEKVKKFIGDRISTKTVSGKMKKDRQEKILRDFRDNKFSCLIASSIVEVGIDVPNATVMVVVGADHFGASQLHQIRGRVGRSDLQSYCYFISDSENENTVKRIKAVASTTDGFEIALSDLAIRCEGDILGEEQSGKSAFHFIDQTKDLIYVEQAKEEAKRIYKSKYRDMALRDARQFLGAESS